MAEEEGNKQAAISSDEGINQKQWLNDADLGAPQLPSLLSDEQKARLTDPKQTYHKDKAAGRNLRATEPRYHPASWRELGGSMLSTPERREEASDAYKLAELYPEHRDFYMEIAGANAIGQRDLLTFEDIEEAESPSIWENIGTALEPFLTPQRMLWYSGLKLGELLPDPGSMFGDAVQDVVGVIGAPFLFATTGILEAGPMAYESLFGEGETQRDDHFSSGKPPAEELALTFRDMVENLYGDVSTGELAAKAEANMRPWLWGDWSTAPAPTGTSILDSMMSYEEAEYLSQKGETRQLRKFGDWMSSDTGRMVMGLSMELIADPLWFTGPIGKGGNVVAHGDKLVRVSKVLTKTAGKLRTLNPKYSKNDFTHSLIHLVEGTDEQIKTAELLLSNHSAMARTQIKALNREAELAKNALKTDNPEDLRKAVRAIADEKIDAQKTISAHHEILATKGAKERGKLFAQQETEKIRLIASDPAKAKVWLNRQVRDLPRRAKVYQGLSDDIGKIVGDISDARKLGGKAGKKALSKFAGKGGRWAVHIPLTTKHGFLLEKGAFESVTELMRKVGPIDNMMDNFAVSALNNTVKVAREASPNISTLDALGGSQAKLAAYTMMNATQSLALIPLASWDVFRRALGTRYLQPMTQSLHLRGASESGFLPVLGAGTKTIQRIKKVHPKVWEQYQEGLTKMMEGYTGLETQLRGRILRLFKLAGQTADTRRKKSAAEVARLTALRGRSTDPVRIAELNFEIDRAKMWGNTKEYTIKNIMNEAGSALEEGAGKLEKLSDDALEVGKGARAIIDAILNDPTIKAGKLEVEQALVAMARLAKGSNIEKTRILGDLKLIEEKLSTMNLAKEVATRKMRRAYTARLAELRSATKVIETIRPEALTSAIQRMIETPESPADLLNDFVRIFGTEEAARSVLRSTAIAMGNNNEATAMRMFAEKIAGDLPTEVIKDSEKLREAIGRGIKDYLSSLKSESARLHNSWVQGSSKTKIGQREFFPGMKSDDFDDLANSLIEREILSWKVLVPSSERAAFEKWASRGQVQEENILAILDKRAPIVSAGSEHWQDAFGFYSRAKALEQVKVTARKWASSTDKVSDIQRQVLPIASRGSKEEMYRVADAAVAEGATVSDRYIEPSRWRRKPKPKPEPKHVPVQAIPDKDLYVPTPEELAAELEFETNLLALRDKFTRVFDDKKVDNSKFLESLGLTKNELQDLMTDLYGKSHLKSLAAKETLRKIFREKAVIQPPGLSTKKIDVDFDLIAQDPNLSVAAVQKKVGESAEIQIGRALFRDSDSTIVETTILTPSTPPKKRITDKEFIEKQYKITGNRKLFKLEKGDEYLPDPVLDLLDEIGDVPVFVHDGKYRLTGRSSLALEHWPKPKPTESIYYFPKQEGPPGYNFLKGEATPVAGRPVDLGVKDGREYFVFKQVYNSKSKQGALKQGDEVTGLHGGIDDIEKGPLMESGFSGAAKGEAEGVHVRIIHRGEDLEEQLMVPILNKKEKLQPGYGTGIHYVQVRSKEEQVAAVEISGMIRAGRERLARKRFEKGPNFAEYQKVTGELNDQRVILQSNIQKKIDQLEKALSKLERSRAGALRASLADRPAIYKRIDGKEKEINLKLKPLLANKRKFVEKKITPLEGRLSTLKPPPVAAGKSTENGVLQVVGHEVEISSMLERQFFVYMDKSTNNWHVVDTTTGARVSQGHNSNSAVSAANHLIEEEGRISYFNKLDGSPSLWGFGEKQVKKVFTGKPEWRVKDVASGLTRGKGPTREAAIDAAKNKTNSKFDSYVAQEQAKPNYRPVLREVSREEQAKLPWQLYLEQSGKPHGNLWGGKVALARTKERTGKALMPITKERIKEAQELGATFILGNTKHLDRQLALFLDEIGANYTVYHAGDVPIVTRPVARLESKTLEAIESASPRRPFSRYLLDELRVPEKPKRPPLNEFPEPVSAFNPMVKRKVYREDGGQVVDVAKVVDDLDPAVKFKLEKATERAASGIDKLLPSFQKEFSVFKEANIKDMNPRLYNTTPTPDGLLFSVLETLKKLSGPSRRNPFPDMDSLSDLELLLRDLDSFSSGLGKQFKASDSLSKKIRAASKKLNQVKNATGGKKHGPLGLFHDEFVQILKGLTIGGKQGSATIKIALRKLQRKYGKDLKLALPRHGEAIRRPLGPSLFDSASVARRIRQLDDDTVLETLASLVVKDGISDAKMRGLLKNIYKKSNARKTLSQATEETLLADMTKVKSDLLEVSRVKFGVSSKTGKFSRGDIATKIFADVRKENKLITDKHNKLTDEYLGKMKELRTALNKNIEPKTIGDRTRKGWENRLWNQFSALSTKHGLSNQDQLFAAFSVLSEMPRNISPDMMKNLTSKYPNVIGRRFGDIEKDLAPVMEELESLIKFYELEYSDRIWDIVRSPETMMERWGVLDFVPHTFHAGTDEVSLQLSMAGKSQLGSGKGIHEMFFRQMDAAKGRKIAGSINEINAFNHAKEGAVDLINLEPALLWGRYAQVNHALTNDTFIQTLISTGVIRGLRSGDATIAKDYGISLTRGDGLAKTADEIALELDMVPLFDRSVQTEEMNRFMMLTLDDLLNTYATSPGKVGHQEVSKALEQVADSLQEASKEKGFANWMNTSKNINALRKLEQTSLRLRAAQAAEGADLFNPRKRYDELLKPELANQVAKWDATEGIKLNNALPDDEFNAARKIALSKLDTQVSRKIWDDVSAEMNALRSKYTPNAPKTQGMHLSAYYDPKAGLWEMYMPRGVHQSMKEVINMDPRSHGLVGRGLEKFNNWWKTRVTVIAIAFSTRNWGANNVSMAFDLGPLGVLNPKTHMQGLKLSNAVRFYDEFGSLEKASRAAKKALPSDATLSEKAKHAALQSGFRFGGLQGLLDNGVQLTDDLWMPIDELMERMTRTGVVSPAYTQVVDINAMEQAMSHMHLHGGALADGTTAAKLKKYASNIEDAVLVTVPTMMTGGVPVAMSKKVGAEFARGVENQSRIFNFLSNIKKTNNWDDSVAHVNKFLFNYGDLTQTQKRWMRLILPWFTWNQKNFILQADLMQKSPALFSSFHKMMSDGLPQVMAASQAEAAGERFVNYDPLSKERLKTRETHSMHTIQMPLPSLENFGLGNVSVPVFKRGKKGVMPWQSFDMQWGKLGKDYFPRLKNAHVQGFGLPQEAFINNLSLLMTGADVRNWPWLPLPGDLGKQQRARSFASRSRWIRMAGETHALIRLAAEIGSGQHTYFNKPINELTDGRLLSETINGIRQVPFVGDTMGDILSQRVGMKGYTVYDKWSGNWKEFIRVDGAANHSLGQLPWSRTLRDAAAMTDQFLMSRLIPWEALAAEGISPQDFGEVPVLWSALDALSGVRIMQTDPDLMRSYADIRTEKQLQKYLESRGLLKSFQNSYIPYKY